VSNPIKVLVVDDHQVLTQGLGALFETTDDVRLVASASCGRDAIAIVENTPLDVMLLDLRLPDMTGFDVLRQVRPRLPELKILILTSHDGDEAIRRTLEAGASGYIPKYASGDAIVRAIRIVAAGQTFLAPEIATTLAATEGGERLTARERQVLHLAASGNANRDIAIALHCAERTVKYHLNCVFQKLGVADRTQAIREGLRRGFIDE
jgi:two-component system, NarL family, response regulator